MTFANIFFISQKFRRTSKQTNNNRAGKMCTFCFHFAAITCPNTYFHFASTFVIFSDVLAVVCLCIVFCVNFTLFHFIFHVFTEPISFSIDFSYFLRSRLELQARVSVGVDSSTALSRPFVLRRGLERLFANNNNNNNI